MNPNKLVVGVVAPICAGKQFFYDLLATFAKRSCLRAEQVHSSAILAQILRVLRRDENDRTERAKLFHAICNGLESKTIESMINDNLNPLSLAAMLNICDSGADIVVYDSVRTLSDEHMVRRLPNSIIVEITASSEVRYERAKKRGNKTGEAEMSYEEFLAQDRMPTECLVGEIGKRANFSVTNNNGELTDTMQSFFSVDILPKLTP